LNIYPLIKKEADNQNLLPSPNLVKD